MKTTASTNRQRNLLLGLPARVALVATALFVAARAGYSAPEDLYVIDSATAVYRVASSGDTALVSSGFYQAMALAFDHAGNLFVADSGATGSFGGPTPTPPPSKIVQVLPDGTQKTFATLPQQFQLLDMAFDGAGNLFVSGSDMIVKISSDGTQSTFASNVRGAWGLAFDNLGNLYVGTSFDAAILKFAPDGSSTTFVSHLAGDPSGLAFAPNGDLFAITTSGVLRINRAGATSTFVTDYFSFNSIAFDGAGNLFLGKDAYSSKNGGGIFKYSLDGQSTTVTTAVQHPVGLAFEPVTEKIRNISARGFVSTGDNVLIGGFIVGGNALANNAVVVRAIGPSMVAAGVTNALSDPLLELHDASGAIIATNDDWQTSQRPQIVASGLAPSDSHESAILATLPAGNYTAVVRGSNGSTGTALVEVYSVYHY